MDLKNVVASSVGNTLEWFDFALFVYLAPIIGAQFFPTHDPVSASIAAFGVFAAGFICRPLGGILFGHLGDKFGRAKTLRWSILGISCATLSVGILPTYEAIGIFAAISLVILRMALGLFVGGEHSGVMVYLVELAPKNKRGFLASFGIVGANLGFLLAILTVVFLQYVMPESILHAWGWRIPFIFIGLMGFVILYHRLQLSETAAFLQLKQKQIIDKFPLGCVIQKCPAQLVRVIGLTCMGSTLYFIFFGYVANYLPEQGNHVAVSTVMLLQAVALLVMILLLPIAAVCGDYFGRKKMLQYAVIGVIISAIPMFSLLQYGAPLLILICLLVATLLSVAEQGNLLTAVVESFPSDVRYTGVSFAYNLGNALFGGTAPLVVSLLVQKFGAFAPAYYLMGMASVSLIAVLSLPSQSRLSTTLKVPIITAFNAK